MSADKRPRRPRIKKKDLIFKPEELEEEVYYDQYGQVVSKEEKEEEDEKIRLSELADSAYQRLKADFAAQAATKNEGYDFALDVKEHLKFIQQQTFNHEKLHEEEAVLKHGLEKIRYAEETDDFSVFKYGRVQRGDTEEQKYKLRTAIERVKVMKDNIWGKVNLMKNTLFMYYLLLGETNSLIELHKIYKLLKEGLQTSHFSVYKKDGAKVDVRAFDKSESRIISLLERAVAALETIAYRVNAVKDERIDEMMGFSRKEEIEGSVEHFYSRTSPEAEYERQKEKTGGRKE